MIDVDQDALGKQARIVRKSQDEFVLAKPMADGSTAVGLFNLNEGAREMRVDWSDLGLRGTQRIRDLWRQKDAGSSKAGYTIRLPRHGVALVRLFPQ